jgi:hypothetical protein
MSDNIRIMCGDIMLIALTATCCLALAVGAVLGIICVIKWLRGDFKECEIS